VRGWIVSSSWARAGALSVLVLGQGCGHGAPEPAEGRRAQAITGDASDDDSDPAVVALSIRTQGGDEGLCSGFVVAPRVVLTAAHCVSPAAVGQGATFSVYLGSDLGDAAQTSLPESHAVVERVDYDADFDLDAISTGHDLGVVITATPLPAAPLALEPVPSLDGVSEVRVVGYGVSSVGLADAGRRRQAIATLTGHSELFLELGDGPVPCEGDSGGPVLVSEGDGVERVAGVVSFTPGGWGPGVEVTNAATYLPYIESAIESAERAPAGGSGDSGCSLGSRGRNAPVWLLSLLLAFALVRAARNAR